MLKELSMKLGEIVKQDVGSGLCLRMFQNQFIQRTLGKTPPIICLDKSVAGATRCPIAHALASQTGYPVCHETPSWIAPGRARRGAEIALQIRVAHQLNHSFRPRPPCQMIFGRTPQEIPSFTDSCPRSPRTSPRRLCAVRGGPSRLNRCDPGTIARRRVIVPEVERRRSVTPSQLP